MAGLFFCFASAEGAGLLFCPAAIRLHRSVYSVFCTVNAVIPPTPQNSAQGFTGAFPTIAPAKPPANTRPIQAAIIPPAPRWSTSQRRNTSNTYRMPAPRRTLYRPTQPPYYNKVYKGATDCRPCQPGGVSSCRVWIAGK